MFSNADFSVKEITQPVTKWCVSGHFAPDMFKREGPDRPEEPTKFFHVIGKDIDGIYCELCLIIANYVAQQNKRK